MNLEELQKEQAAAQFEALKKQLLLQFLTKEARSRLNTVRVAHPQLAAQVELAILQAVQLGQLKEKIDEQKLKEILARARPEKKGFRLIKK